MCIPRRPSRLRALLLELLPSAVCARDACLIRQTMASTAEASKADGYVLRALAPASLCLWLTLGV